MKRAGSLNSPVAVKTCVLYDPQTGHIVHTHRVVTMPGGREFSDKEVEERTRDRAKQLGRQIGTLHALHVTPEECDCSSQYRVDLGTKRLHKLERPAPSSTK